jgi:hypothetical protein
VLGVMAGYFGVLAAMAVAMSAGPPRSTASALPARDQSRTIRRTSVDW